MIKHFQKMFKALNANQTPGELAHAFSLGMLLAFIPKGNLLWIIVFLLVFFLRINRGTMFLTIILWSIFTPLLDPLFHITGYSILTSEALTPTFAALLEIPFVAFTCINNTIVMGSLACGIIMYIPFYLLARLFVKEWRRKLYPLFIKSKIYQIFIKTPFLQTLWKLKEADHE